jgi:hypothetical protein
MAFRRKADRAHRHQHSVQDTHRGREIDEDHKRLQLGLNRQNCELRSSLGRLPGGLSFCSTAEKHFRAATAGAMLTSVPGAVRRRPCGSFAPSAINHNPTVRSMMTRKKPREDWIARDLPVVAELKQCGGLPRIIGRGGRRSRHDPRYHRGGRGPFSGHRCVFAGSGCVSSPNKPISPNCRHPINSVIRRVGFHTQTVAGQLVA